MALVGLEYSRSSRNDAAKKEKEEAYRTRIEALHQQHLKAEQVGRCMTSTSSHAILRQAWTECKAARSCELITTSRHSFQVILAFADKTAWVLGSVLTYKLNVQRIS